MHDRRNKLPYAEIDAISGDISVTTQWTEKDVIKAIPGSRWDAKNKIWKLPLAWGSCVTLRGFFGDSLHIGEGLVQWATTYRGNRVDRTMAMRDRIDGIRADEESLLDDLIKSYRDDVMALYPFQENGVEFLMLAGDALLGDEMGCGKTPMSLVGLRALAEIGHDALPALVIAPNSVKDHWAEKAPIWAPGIVPYIVKGNATQRRKILAEAKEDPNALVIINVEALRQFSRLAPYGSVRLKKCKECDRYGDDVKVSLCEAHPKELNGFGFKTVILDEAHRCKDPKSKQTRAWWAIAHNPSVTRRWAMTGTPIAQHVGDLWSIMHGIAPYDFPIKSKFIERYALTSWNAFGGLDIVGVKPDTRHELYAILDPHFRRMTKSLVLPQLPKKIYEKRYVEMSPAQRKMYKEMARDHLTFTPDGEMLITPNQLTAQTRLSQIAAAAIKIDKPDEDDPTTWVWTLKNPSPKLDEFMDVIEDVGDVPVVVCAEHKQLINLAAERLEKSNIPHALITGDISEFDRKRALQYLNERKIKALLFTAKAGGTGLDMSAADTIIMLQRPWSMVENLQAEDRVHRIGSEIHDAIRVVDIVMRDSIEETQIERFYIKKARMEEITRDRDRLRAAGVDTSTLDAEYARIMQSDLGVPILDLVGA